MRKISYILSDNGGGDHVTDRWTDAEKFLFFLAKCLDSPGVCILLLKLSVAISASQKTKKMFQACYFN